MTVELDDLLERSKLLNSSLDRILHPDLPKLQWTLDELRNKCASLATNQRGNYTKAHYLLAGSGINAEHTSRAINSLQVEDVQEATASVETDIDAYVRNSREQSIIKIIEARKQQAQVDFQAFMDKHLATSWETRKRRLMQQFSGDKNAAQEEPVKDKSLGRSQFGKSVNARRRAYQLQFDDVDTAGQSMDAGAGAWEAKEQTFAQAISSLNEHRMLKQPIAVSTLMSQLVRTLGADVRTQQMADAWQALAYIVDEKRSEHGRESVGKLLKPREYAQQYALKPTTDSQLTRQLTKGARSFLESQFFAMVEREIARNPQEARLGGVPSVESKIKAYANIRFAKNGQWVQSNVEIVNSTPIWAVLFFLLRAGFLDEAVAFATKNESYISRLEKNFVLYLKAYAANEERRLPRQLHDRLHSEYNQTIKYVSEASDPYKHALYKIIGRCDLARRSLPEVLPVTEDWMWLQLVLCRETDTSGPAYEQFGLRDLQATLVRFGSRHFNPKGSNPLLYFQLLLLSGQFERAVHYLASHSWTDAVHFAAILAYFGLLRVATPEAAAGNLLSTPDNAGEAIDFTSMAILYARGIQHRASTTAVEYLCLISLSSDLRDGSILRKACHEATRELVLETRDFAVLLGDVRVDGTRAPGFVEKRKALLALDDDREYLRTISEQAATAAAMEGRIADAVLLYHLSEQYDTVVAMICKTLGEALLDPNYGMQAAPSEGPGMPVHAEDPAVLARNMSALYNGNAAINGQISQRSKTTVDLLLRMVSVRQAYGQGKVEQCLALIAQLGIIPMQEALPIGAIKKQAQDFSMLEESVARNVPSVLTLSIRCLKQVLHTVQQGAFGDATRQAKARQVKQKAKNVVLFAGMIRYSIESEVFEHLMDAELLV
ncbi:Nup93/Nic96-domain-containing protein [Protomyces lactucae-debilis]|uniref:Nuclear pore protein n=1 Tax=Protomyces lactucae-debilis TaxID=2754530 RepID=A0A1Y2FNS2_PROLT|nr:Nup93/Nic96-domain-containing protein [Protomyces lactucae-debilis]ORY84866.1 Nup93/Nic96-domain-containing protein [Protomyces lactucae-debilis]